MSGAFATTDMSISENQHPPRRKRPFQVDSAGLHGRMGDGRAFARSCPLEAVGWRAAGFPRGSRGRSDLFESVTSEGLGRVSKDIVSLIESAARLGPGHADDSSPRAREAAADPGSIKRSRHVPSSCWESTAEIDDSHKRRWRPHTPTRDGCPKTVELKRAPLASIQGERSVRRSSHPPSREPVRSQSRPRP